MEQNAVKLSRPKSGLSKKHVKQNVFYWCMLAFPLLQFAIFYLYVNFRSLLFTVQSYDYTVGKYAFSGLTNFTNVLSDLSKVNYLVTALKNSLILFAVTLLVGVSVALVSSYYIYKKYRFSEAYKIFLFLPSVISAVTLVVMFKYFSDRAVPYIWENLFGKEILGLLSDPDKNFVTILLFTVFTGLGPQILMYSGSMNGISDSIMEAAELDGAKNVKEFVYIVVPLIWPTLSTYVIVNFALLFVNQMNLFSFFGPSADYSVYTIGYFLYKEIQSPLTSFSQYPYLATMGIVFTSITIPLTFFVRFITKKLGPET